MRITATRRTMSIGSAFKKLGRMKHLLMKSSTRSFQVVSIKVRSLAWIFAFIGLLLPHCPKRIPQFEFGTMIQVKMNWLNHITRTKKNSKTLTRPICNASHSILRASTWQLDSLTESGFIICCKTKSENIDNWILKTAIPLSSAMVVTCLHV